MSNSAKSVFANGIYEVILGIPLLVAPNLLLGLFGLPATSEVWIRVVGLLFLLFAYLMIRAAHAELTEFFRWTVHARASIIVFVIAFVALGLVQPILILFGVIDLLSAIWTGLTLRGTSHE